MEFIDTTEHDSYVELTLDRPEARNALDLTVLAELEETLEQLSEDGTEGILLTGTGDVTCAGADLAIIEDGTDEERRELTARSESVYELLNGYPRPTVMAAKGAAVGAGFQLGVACDFVIVGEETTLLKPEMQYGLYSGYASKMIQEKVGQRAAWEITLIGEPISPERAHSLGVAQDVVPESEVEATAEELLELLVSNGEEAYDLAKRDLGFDADADEFDSYP